MMFPWIWINRTVIHLVTVMVDGDGLVVNRLVRPKEVRFYGVDAPEWNQAWGAEAKAFVEGLALDERVLVKPDSYDRYGRTVAVVILPDGRDLSRELVGAGLAWWYRKYAPKDKNLAALEAEAKAAGRGLWGDVGAVAPWRYRRR